MKTKLLIVPILFLLFSVQVFGEGSALDRIVDNAGILSDSQKNDLISLMDSIALAYKFDLVIVTEESIGDASPSVYADDFFDNNGYGLGTNRDGCLFLRVTGTREYWLSASGRGIKILNSYAGQKLDSDTENYLGKNDPYAAFSAFVQDWDQFLSMEAKGRSYNFIHQWNLVFVIIAWLIAIGIGFITVYIWKRGMNTALPQTQAAAYVVAGSLNFTVKKESFLYSKTTKIKRSSGNSGGGAASSLLRSTLSSSGRSHSGRGGRR